jgi:tetratricopeptide (TPR) repeat protein
MEEVLYNAARAFQAARDIPKAITVRQILMDPTYHLENTDLARRAAYEIGGIYQALADYEQAATWYERYARENPKSDKSPDALSDAIVLRLALGQEADAIKDSELFNKNYGSSKPEHTARIAFVVGAHDIEKEDWGAARKKLSSAMSLIDRNAALDVQIQAHAMLGRVFVKLDTAASAVTEYDKVRGMWKDPAAVVKKIQETGDDRRLAKALTALGEALFFFAEEKRQAAEAIRLPGYSGSGRHEDIAELLATKVAPVMTARRKAVEDAEKAYFEVLEIQPIPPPRWVVAAAERVARMRGLLAAELRALPAPKSWKRQGRSPWGPRWEDVRAAWRDALIDASEPDHLAARAAYRRCVELSLKMRSFDDHTQQCTSWLERNFAAEYPRLDEIAPRPSHLASGLYEHEKPEPDRRPGAAIVDTVEPW